MAYNSYQFYTLYFILYFFAITECVYGLTFVLYVKINKILHTCRMLKADLSWFSVFGVYSLCASEVATGKCLWHFPLVFLMGEMHFFIIKRWIFFLWLLLRKSDGSLETLFSHHKHFLSLLRKLPLIKCISEALQKDLALNFKIMVVNCGLFPS